MHDKHETHQHASDWEESRALMAAQTLTYVSALRARDGGAIEAKLDGLIASVDALTKAIPEAGVGTNARLDELTRLVTQLLRRQTAEDAETINNLTGVLHGATDSLKAAVAARTT